MILTLPLTIDIKPASTIAIFHERDHRYLYNGYLCERVEMVFERGQFNRVDARACLKRPPGWFNPGKQTEKP